MIAALLTVGSLVCARVAFYVYGGRFACAFFRDHRRGATLHRRPLDSEAQLAKQQCEKCVRGRVAFATRPLSVLATYACQRCGMAFTEDETETADEYRARAVDFPDDDDPTPEKP